MADSKLQRLRGFPIHRTGWLCALLATLGFLLPTYAQYPQDLPGSAASILSASCGNAGCHGGSTPYGFSVRDLSSMLSARVVNPGDSTGSEIIRRIESGAMPLGGTRLPDEQIAILKRWIDAGAPAWAAPAAGERRAFVAESEILDAILRDLETAPATDRRYRRYFSLVNLWNNPEVTEAELAHYGPAFGKLVNHLSWQRDIALPEAIDARRIVYRIDLRDYFWDGGWDGGWDGAPWRYVEDAYPYGFVPSNLQEHANRIQWLSGAASPYVRMDWFIAAASAPPLYHAILELPETIAQLEERLGVNSEFNVERGLAQRFGLRNSGVSRNNRVMERHATAYGAYWKSYDFAGNQPERNIFRNPLDLSSDGGEMIFHLPNGLQSYFIADERGRRIDAAPIAVVRDLTHPDDPAVRNGRSCMGCHFGGLNTFQDEIGGMLRTRTLTLFNLERALELYPGQPELEAWMESDNARFAGAMRHLGLDLPAGSSDEPVSRLARRYDGNVTVSQAAADLYIQDVQQLQYVIENSVELQADGLDQFLAAGSGVKRDFWEESFMTAARRLRNSPPAPLSLVKAQD